MQQGELEDFLVRREQIALDPVGEEGERLLPGIAALDALALRGQALRDPLRQRGALDRVDAQRDAGCVERGEPGAGELRAVQPRQL